MSASPSTECRWRPIRNRSPVRSSNRRATTSPARAPVTAARRSPSAARSSSCAAAASNATTCSGSGRSRAAVVAHLRPRLAHRVRAQHPPADAPTDRGAQRQTREPGWRPPPTPALRIDATQASIRNGSRSTSRTGTDRLGDRTDPARVVTRGRRLPVGLLRLAPEPKEIGDGRADARGRGAAELRLPSARPARAPPACRRGRPSPPGGRDRRPRWAAATHARRTRPAAAP